MSRRRAANCPASALAANPQVVIEEHAEGYACLMESLHGIRDARGYADGSDMVDKHRMFFEECLGMRYQQFDDAWGEWALKQTAKKRAEGKRFRNESRRRSPSPHRQIGRVGPTPRP